MKTMRLCIFVNLVLAAVFSLLSISPHLDLSLLAFPLSLLFTLAIGYVALVVLLRRNAVARLNMVRRFFQYEPFVFISAFVLQRSGESGMPFALDLAAALVWVCIMASSFIILRGLSEKRIAAVNPGWGSALKEHPPAEYHGVRRVGIEILEWVDALVQAVFTIVLLNIFIFQLYEIPSESMVPTFLVKDRVAVFKTLSGPKFPLSSVGLPSLQKYTRGDIVVFRNPHYTDDRKSEVRTFLSQFIYMLTLTFVKTNTDEHGELKADPLVKRITGLPGEQLMLMDGTLYARRSGEDGFAPVGEDEGWAAWNMVEYGSLFSTATNSMKIEKFPMSNIYKEQVANVGRNRSSWSVTLGQALEEEESLYAGTLAVEEARRGLDLLSAAFECQELSREFAALARGGEASDVAVRNFFSKDDLFEFYLFRGWDASTTKLLTAAGGREWFEHFMNDWQAGLDSYSSYMEAGAVTGSHLLGGDLYTDSRFRLNVMCKLVFGRLVARNALLLSGGVPERERMADAVIQENLAKAQQLHDYLIRMDQRNMGMFPACAADGSPRFIPEDCYFMMGDNRYNSTDMRHSYEPRLEPLTALDGYSVAYYSNLAPQYVERSRIQGKASLRFWPLTRFGVPGRKNLRGN